MEVLPAASVTNVGTLAAWIVRGLWRRLPEVRRHQPPGDLGLSLRSQSTRESVRLKEMMK